MKAADLIALDDSGIELTSPAGLSEFAPEPIASPDDVENEKQIEEVKCRICGSVDQAIWCPEHSGHIIIHQPDCNFVLFDDDCDCPEHMGGGVA